MFLFFFFLRKRGTQQAQALEKKIASLNKEHEKITGAMKEHEAELLEKIKNLEAQLAKKLVGLQKLTVRFHCNETSLNWRKNIVFSSSSTHTDFSCLKSYTVFQK